jgi:adenylate cyclase
LSIKKFLSSLCCLCITFIILFLLKCGGFDKYADTALYDFFLGLKVTHNPRALNPQIIPIDLSDRSEMILGEKLDDRTAFGDLFSVIAHSNAQIALDFIYRGERENDQYMLEMASMLKTLIVAVIPVPEGRENVSYRELNQDEADLLREHIWRPKEFGKGNAPRAGTFIMPFLEFGRLATRLAHISIDPDPDGIFRRTPLFYAWEDGYIPAISISSALCELGINGDDIEIHWGKKIIIPLGPNENIYVPIDSAGNVVVPFGGKWEDTTRRYSMDVIVSALQDRQLLNEIRNDIMRSLCFAADTTFAKKDLGPVPFEKVYLLSGLHTWVISGILDASIGEDYFFREVPAYMRVIILIFFAILFLLLGTANKDLIYNSVSASVFITFTGITLYLWFFRLIIPWYTAGVIVILLIWLSGFIYRFFTQRQRQSALERYVPRPVAHKLVTGQRITLVPVVKELTIMFSDIKSFAAWSSEKEAGDVHGFLNDYLETMADTLFAHGATVDKFMGDGILSFFGDPLDMPNHAEEAVKAAIAMQKKVQILRDKWQPRVGIDLKIRVGINTGKVIVGDLGTRRRIEYTVIGSTVNLAQRMESLAPPGGILVTDHTRTAIEAAYKDGAFAKGTCPYTFSENLELTVKGYDKSITCYTVVF